MVCRRVQLYRGRRWVQKWFCMKYYWYDNSSSLISHSPPKFTRHWWTVNSHTLIKAHTPLTPLANPICIIYTQLWLSWNMCILTSHACTYAFAGDTLCKWWSMTILNIIPNSLHISGTMKIVNEEGDLQKELSVTIIRSRIMRRCMGVELKDDDKESSG